MLLLFDAMMMMSEVLMLSSFVPFHFVLLVVTLFVFWWFHQLAESCSSFVCLYSSTFLLFGFERDIQHCEVIVLSPDFFFFVKFGKQTNVLDCCPALETERQRTIQPTHHKQRATSSPPLPTIPVWISILSRCIRLLLRLLLLRRPLPEEAKYA